MSQIKAWMHDYQDALDDAWMALEDAIAKVDALAEQCWVDDNTIRCHAPASDVQLLRNRMKELKLAFAAVECAQEPSKLPPILPGEQRLAW